MAQLIKHYDNLTQIKLYRISGMVVDSQTATTTHTHVSGGGGKIHNGTGYIEPIRTETSTTTEHDVYLKTDDGNLQHHTIGNELSYVKFRNGHQIDIYFIEGHFFNTQVTQKKVAISNNTINSYYFREHFIGIGQGKFNRTFYDALLACLLLIIIMVLLPTGIIVSLLILMMPFKGMPLIIVVTLASIFLMHFFFKYIKRKRIDNIIISYQTSVQIKKDVTDDIKNH